MAASPPSGSTAHESERLARLRETVFGQTQPPASGDATFDLRLHRIELRHGRRTVGAAFGSLYLRECALSVGEGRATTEHGQRDHHTRGPVGGTAKGLVDGGPIGAHDSAHGGQPARRRTLRVGTGSLDGELRRDHVTATRVDCRCAG